MAESTKTQGFFDTLVETQAKFVNEAVETTKKLAKDLPIVNETLDKGHKLYQDTVKVQKETIQKTTENFNKTKAEMNQQSTNAQNFFQQWFENQMNWAKNAFNQTTANTTNNTDWMAPWQNWMNQSQQYFATANQQNPFMNAMNQNPFANWMNQNPMMNQESMQKNVQDNINTWAQHTKEYFDFVNASFTNWQSQFENATTANSFKGMQDLNQNMTKFFELWMPMMKSMNEKTFNTEIFSQMLSPEKFKAFIDQFFKFMPEGSQKMMDQMNVQFINMMKQASESGLNGYNSFKNQMSQMPRMTRSPHASMWTMNQQWREGINEAVSPLTKLINGNEQVENAKLWSDLADKMAEFSLKNNELQYMIYQNGLKAMDKLAVKVATQVKNGESIESIVKLYQEWMMTGDEVFTKLFSSDEYSKLMTEVSSLQMKIKSEIDRQMEKMMLVNIPVATRTEMDEVYKNLYDLKKMYKNLERAFTAMSEATGTTKSSTPAPKAPAAKAAAPATASKKAAPAKKVAKKK